MTVIVCLDNANGMMFNNRRQSRDANVIKDICETATGKRLLVGPYSAPLFGANDVIVSESFLDEARADDYCFVENVPMAKYLNKIDSIIVYKWNRDYPSDFFFDIDYTGVFRLESEAEFVGTSHDKITKEVYVK